MFYNNYCGVGFQIARWASVPLSNKFTSTGQYPEKYRNATVILDPVAGSLSLTGLY